MNILSDEELLDALRKPGAFDTDEAMLPHGRAVESAVQPEAWLGQHPFHTWRRHYICATCDCLGALFLGSGLIKRAHYSPADEARFRKSAASWNKLAAGGKVAIEAAFAENRKMLGGR